MIKIETFAVIGGDMRFSYLAGALAKEGFSVITAGLEGTDPAPGVTACTNLPQAISLADCVVLPLPLTTDGVTLHAPLSRVSIRLEEVAGSLSPGQYVAGGGLPADFMRACTDRGAAVGDYLKREELAILNSVPTAEGAVQLAMEEMPVTLHGCSCLVAGFGRVGATLASLLRAMGACVTVAARSPSARAAARAAGCRAVDMTALTEGEYAVIFNTVPACVFTAEVLKNLDRGVLLIDLASRPGGVDFQAAAALSLKTVWALSLPGRVAPKSAAGVIAHTLLNMVGEVSA